MKRVWGIDKNSSSVKVKMFGRAEGREVKSRTLFRAHERQESFGIPLEFFYEGNSHLILLG